MNLRYKVRALRDIEAIHIYIARNDILAAKRVVAWIEHSISRLALHPFSGRAGVVREREFWWFRAFHMLRSIVFAMKRWISSRCSIRPDGDAVEQVRSCA
jgi:plasmid stabilization system protein ParE